MSDKLKTLKDKVSGSLKEGAGKLTGKKDLEMKPFEWKSTDFYGFIWFWCEIVCLKISTL